MFSLRYITLLATEEDRMQSLFRALRSNNARGEASDTVYGLLIIAGILTVMLIFSVVSHSRHQRRNYESPVRLFLSLCKAHKLKWRERWLLYRLARMEQLTDPARLFLEPQWYTASNLPTALRQHEAKLKSIHKRLFAGLKENAKPGMGEQSDSALQNQLKGAILPVSTNAPQLDVLPWPSTALSPAFPALTDSSQSPTV